MFKVLQFVETCQGILHLSKNMRVMLQNDQSGDIFSKQPIDICNDTFSIDVLANLLLHHL